MPVAAFPSWRSLPTLTAWRQWRWLTSWSSKNETVLYCFDGGRVNPGRFLQIFNRFEAADFIAIADQRRCLRATERQAALEVDGGCFVDFQARHVVGRKVGD